MSGAASAYFNQRLAVRAHISSQLRKKNINNLFRDWTCWRLQLKAIQHICRHIAALVINFTFPFWILLCCNFVGASPPIGHHLIAYSIPIFRYNHPNRCGECVRYLKKKRKQEKKEKQKNFQTACRLAQSINCRVFHVFGRRHPNGSLRNTPFNHS